VADPSRIEDLRRRVQQDPTSIAFAQLAEELRRGGQTGEAIEVCRAGLRLYPDYVSVRVTLGRALFALNNLDEAQAELERVLRSAPENLAAARGLADIFQRRGQSIEALAHYRTALSLARKDPELQQIVARLDAECEMHASDPVRESPLALEPPPPLPLDAERDHALRTIAALEHFLEASREH